jgi:hypothetical protein
MAPSAINTAKVFTSAIGHRRREEIVGPRKQTCNVPVET